MDTNTLHVGAQVTYKTVRGDMLKGTLVELNPEAPVRSTRAYIRLDATVGKWRCGERLGVGPEKLKLAHAAS